MWLAYVIALIPVIIGAVLWINNREIVWWEWIVSSLVGFVIAFLFNIIAIYAMTIDTETWSGRITEAVYQPEWIEEYQEMHTSTDSKGHTRVWYTTEHRTHYRNWTAYADFGAHFENYSISENKYNELIQKFGASGIREGDRPGFDSGDRNDYFIINKNHFVEPVHCEMTFENRVKACPSVFSYVKVPEGTPGIFEYPPNGEPFQSNRLLGLAKQHFNIFKFDQLNTCLGASKKVNLVIIGWDSKKFSSSIAQLQESKWIGGKKNDLVVCYGYSEKVDWAYVFGWTEKDIVKRDLATLFLNNKLNDVLLEPIKNEIVANYEIKKWKKFSYLTVEPPGWSYWILIMIMGLVYWLMGYVFLTNDSYK